MLVHIYRTRWRYMAEYNNVYTSGVNKVSDISLMLYICHCRVFSKLSLAALEPQFYNPQGDYRVIYVSCKSVLCETTVILRSVLTKSD
jgi:hypothetical protein